MNFGRCQVRHKEKKPEISRDVEVEVDQRMHEQSSTSHDSRKLQGSHKGKVILAEAREGFEQQSREKPGTTGTAQDACFGKGLQVVVVGVIDDFSVIESFVGRIHDLQRAESRACQRMVQENVPGASAHGGALAFSHFQRLERGEALQNLANAEPCNHQQRREQNRGHAQEMLSQAAATKKQIGEKRKLHTKAHDAAARSREEERGDRHDREERHDGEAFAADSAEHQRNQRQGQDQLHQSREVVAIHVRTERYASVAQFTEPIEFPVEGQMLQNAEHADHKTESHAKPHEAAPIVKRSKRLHA